MFSFWRGAANWPLGYKATPVFALLGAVKSLLIDNYWVVTSMPLAGHSESDPTGKFFYSCAQLIAGAILWGGVGLAVDYLRNDYAVKNPSEDSRLTVNSIV